MKKLLAAIIITCSAAAASAQTGGVLLYGDLNFNFFHQDKAYLETQQLGSINPGIGINISNSFTIGVAGGFTMLSTKDTSINHTTKRWNQSEFNAGLFVRYTHCLSNIFTYYTQLEGGYHGGNLTFDNDPIKGEKFGGIYVGLMPAIGVNVKNGFMLNFAFGGLKYSTTKYEDATTTSSMLDFTFGKQMSIGVSKIIGGHKEGGSKAHSHNMDDDSTPKTKKVDDDE